MIDIIKAHAVNNLCYKAARKMTPKGIVVHSTGANNPTLRRYVDAPDEVGPNQYGTHWNTAKPEGRSVCVHAFIGYDKDNNVRVAEILPLNICCWGVGAIAYDKNGKEVSSSSHPNFDHYGPSYNYEPAYIQFEICEDDLKNKDYYRKAFDTAIEYCAELCKTYNLDVSNIVGHYEAYQRGYGCDHSDPEHWMTLYGETMDDFRNAVSKLLNNGVGKTETKVETYTSSVKFHKGDLVEIAENATYYDGKKIPGWVKVQHWYVMKEPVGDRVVIDENKDGTNSICSPIHKKFLKLVAADQKDKTDTTVVTTEFHKGDLVSIANNATYYDGKKIPGWVIAQQWYVMKEPVGDRVVIDENKDGTNSICSPVNKKFLKLVKAAKKENSTSFEKNNATNKFPYLVKVNSDTLNIYKDPGTNSVKVGAITDSGIYTIVAEAKGEGASLWGKLKSGAGWISLDKVKKR